MRPHIFTLLGLLVLSESAHAGGKSGTVDVDNVQSISNLIPNLLMDDPWSRTEDANGGYKISGWEVLMSKGQWDELILKTDPDLPRIHEEIGPETISFRLIPAESVDLRTTGEIRRYWEEKGWRWPTIRELLAIAQSDAAQGKWVNHARLVSMTEAETLSGHADLVMTFVPSNFMVARLSFFDGFPEQGFPVSREKHEAYLVAILQ